MYFAQAVESLWFAPSPYDGLIKIGCCELGTVENRMKSVRTTYKTDVKVLGLVEGNRATEQEIHQRLSAIRATNCRGREWFKPEKELAGILKCFGPAPILSMSESPTHKLDLFADGVKIIPIGKDFTRLKLNRKK